NLGDGSREDGGATIGLIVAIDTGHDRVAQTHARHGFGDAEWFLFIRWADWLARRHRAETASARADVAENHEGGVPVLPALAHVRAARAFADRVQVQRSHGALQFLVSLAAKEPYTQPIGPRMRIRRRHHRRLRIRDDVKR